MSLRYQGGFITTTFNGLLAPDAPTIGTATAGNTNASVTFTAPSNIGGSAITSYTVLSSPGGLVGTGSSSPITVSGLTNSTAYTFTVFANNVYGNSGPSAASNSVTPVAPTAPPTIEVLVVAGGGGGNTFIAGGGGAGGLSYQAARSITASTSYTVTIGAGGSGSTGTSGSNSVFDTITSNGGGVGGGTATGGGASGGSGGGGNYNTGNQTAGSATQGNTGGATGYGFAGGTGTRASGVYASGGGGGAGAVGTNGSTTGSSGNGGAGGIGRQYEVTNNASASRRH